MLVLQLPVPRTPIREISCPVHTLASSRLLAQSDGIRLLRAGPRDSRSRGTTRLGQAPMLLGIKVNGPKEQEESVTEEAWLVAVEVADGGGDRHRGRGQNPRSSHSLAPKFHSDLQTYLQLLDTITLDPRPLPSRSPFVLCWSGAQRARWRCLFVGGPLPIHLSCSYAPAGLVPTVAILLPFCPGRVRIETRNS
jgi:hypothetical protein